MKKELLAAAAVAALAAQPAPMVLAQSGTPTPPMSEQPTQESQPQPQQDEAAQGEVQEQDQQFAQEAASSNQAELQLATLAEQKAQSEEVKEYASMLVEDHTRVGEELEQLASDEGITLDSEIPPEAQQAHEKLSGMSGSEFDRAFIEQMVTDHEKAVALYEKQAAEGQNEALKQFASTNVDGLRTHLDRARQLERQMGEQPVAGTPGGTPSASQQESMAGSDQPTDQQANPLMQNTAGDLIGKKVVNQQGDEVGEIEDIVIGSDKDVQAVVAVGGFLGIGDKSIAMSFDELRPGEDGNVLLSSGATVEELKQRPAYDEASGDYQGYPADRALGDSDM
jgi:putative membrane protein